MKLAIILSALVLPSSLFAKDLVCEMQTSKASISYSGFGQGQNYSGAVSGRVIVKNQDKPQATYTVLVKPKGKKGKTLQLLANEAVEGEALYLSSSQESELIQEYVDFHIKKDGRFELELLVNQTELMRTQEVIQGVCTLN